MSTVMRMKFDLSVVSQISDKIFKFRYHLNWYIISYICDIYAIIVKNISKITINIVNKN